MDKKTGSSFKPVQTNISFPEMEKQLLKNWYKNGVVKKYLNRNNSSKKYFSFVDGPITANNPMGVHHAWGRTYKDFWQKYKNMRGYTQRFQNGFDCQGLWVEVEVEKELGLKNKKEIENLIPGDKKASIDKFVNLCKERVLKFSEMQTEQTKRLGNFMDWENSYFTMSDENNYMIWHFLKVCNDHGWIYKGRDSVPWCPRCETAISQHEMLTEDYKEAVHESVFFALPVENEDYELLVWTTTPWTIPANVAVAVHPLWEYQVWESSSGRQILILDSGDWEEKIDISERVFKIIKDTWKPKRKVKGDELIGKKYRGPFDELPAVQKARKDNENTFHTVIPAKDLVTPHEGTGLVHIAPGAGTEDFALGREFSLSVIAPIDDASVYVDGFAELSGKSGKKHPELILDYLKKNNFSLGTHHYKHRYPACWRCKTELVWKVADEWYISMDSPSKLNKKNQEQNLTLRQRMIRVAKNINWRPEFGLDRELDWLNNMHDWLISKPNRYWGLALPIYECECGHFEVIGSKAELEKKSVAGWSSFEGHTPHKPWIDEVKIRCTKCKKEVSRLPDVGNVWLDAGIVPFSTIKQNNQGEPLYLKDKQKWLNWFPADLITESFPGQFKNWFYSLIAMSTVLESTNPFKNVLGFATLLAEDGRPMHKSWGNSIEFNEGADKIGADVMRWMYLRQNPAENMLFGYKLGDEVRRQFHLKLWNIYNYFVTYANLAFWSPSESGVNLSTESLSPLDLWILSRLNNTISIVTTSIDGFNSQKAALAIESLVDDLSVWYIRRSRDRQDDTFFAVTHEILVTLSRMLAPFTPFVSEEIYKNLTSKESVHLTDWPDPDVRYTNEELEANMSVIREIVEKAHALRKAKQVKVRQPLSQLTVKNAGLNISNLEYLLKEELNVKKVEFIEQKGDLEVDFNFDITPELKLEGEAREIVRMIQDERKKLGTSLDEKVRVVLPDWPAGFEEYIKQKALVSNLKKGRFNVSANK